LSTSSAPPTLNGTLPVGTAVTGLPVGTGLTALSPDAFTTSTFQATTPTPPAAPPLRRSGETATPEQIAYACADTSNLVTNGDFEAGNGSTALGWDIAPEDSLITFRVAPSTAANGSTTLAAQVLSGAPGRSLTVSQPLTLCPGRQYRLSSANRQGNLLSKCTISYFIGDDEVYTPPSSPQETFLGRSEFFTAGTTPQDVSQDLKITTRFDGEGGALVGANVDGFMVGEFDNVSVMPVLEG
jgi:hypothetical protein